MTLALTIAVISIAITIVGLVVLSQLSRWISKHERMAVDPYASEFGDVVNAPRRSV